VLEQIKQIVKQAGGIALQDYSRASSIVTHKGEIDLVTDTDLKLESFLKDKIMKLFPQHDFLIEETDNQIKSSNNLWIIDPLDGTTNFSHRFPFFAISVAYEKDQEMQLGIVYLPKLDEMFWAEKGKGAYLNGSLILTSRVEEISQSLIATGFPYDRWQKGNYYLQEYSAFMKQCQGVRRAGAAAVDLCYTACGRLDGFFEHKLKPWDTAAGSLIVTEAGGKVSDYLGKKRHYSDATIIASNDLIHNDMINILAASHQEK
jgi:myo-inositol-1(or 4)-monophosphatase